LVDLESTVAPIGMIAALGGWVSVAGSVSSVAGLVLTVWALLAARGARYEASRAKDAAEGARNALRRYDAASDIRDAAAFLGEAARLLPSRKWSQIADRFHAARTAVIRARSGYPDLSQTRQRTCQSAISWLQEAETTLRHWDSDGVEASATEVRLVVDGVLSHHVKIETMSAELRNAIPSEAVEVQNG